MNFSEFNTKKEEFNNFIIENYSDDDIDNMHQLISYNKFIKKKGLCDFGSHTDYFSAHMGDYLVNTTTYKYRYINGSCYAFFESIVHLDINNWEDFHQWFEINRFLNMREPVHPNCLNSHKFAQIDVLYRLKKDAPEEWTEDTFSRVDSGWYGRYSKISTAVFAVGRTVGGEFVVSRLPSLNHLD